MVDEHGEMGAGCNILPGNKSSYFCVGDTIIVFQEKGRYKKLTVNFIIIVAKQISLTLFFKTYDRLHNYQRRAIILDLF